MAASWTACRLPVGIRTLKLDQSPDPDEPGTRFFRFVLNGVPIFARGANWIPASSFVGALTADRYEQLLTTARDANMNMLRIWGGGIYEHDAFYELCDRLGILIWQDFMFACAPYPEDDPAFVDEVRAEARLPGPAAAQPPLLALWCGNNENQWLHRCERHGTSARPLFPAPSTTTRSCPRRCRPWTVLPPTGRAAPTAARAQQPGRWRCP